MYVLNFFYYFLGELNMIVSNENDIALDSIGTKNHTAIDIENYVGTNVNDFIKRQLLLNPWMPPKNYTFPFSLHKKKGKEEWRYAGDSNIYIVSIGLFFRM